MSGLAKYIEERIREAFTHQSFDAVVTAVDKDDDTITVKPEGKAERTGVRLKSVVEDSESKIVVYPAIDSVVVVGVLHNDNKELFVQKVNTIDEVIVNCPNMVINGGENGGLTITPELKEQLNKMSARIDALYDAIKNGVPIAQDGGAGYQATMKAILATVAQSEDFSNIENDKVTH